VTTPTTPKATQNQKKPLPEHLWKHTGKKHEKNTENKPDLALEREARDQEERGASSGVCLLVCFIVSVFLYLGTC